jgi:hypothetical protein
MRRKEGSRFQQQQGWKHLILNGLLVHYKVIAAIVIVLWIIYTTHQSIHYVDYSTSNHQHHYHLLRSMQERCNNTAMSTDRTSAVTTTKLLSDTATTNACQSEFHRLMTTDMTSTTMALTKDDYERSIANVGNRYRILQFVTKLIHSSTTENSSDSTTNATTSTTTTTPKGVTVIVCGASITMGHGVEPKEGRYLNIFENWLNLAYPITTKNTTQNNNDPKQQPQEPDQHRVLFRGMHGVNVSQSNDQNRKCRKSFTLIPKLSPRFPSSFFV